MYKSMDGIINPFELINRKSLPQKWRILWAEEA